jgi:hypothetical protein
LLKTRYSYRENDAPVEFKPQVTITLPAPLPMARFIEHDEPATLLAPAKPIKERGRG